MCPGVELQAIIRYILAEGLLSVQGVRASLVKIQQDYLLSLRALSYYVDIT